MLSFFRKSKINSQVYDGYNIIMAQSRQPVFFAEWGVTDSVTGRFDVLSLHMALVLRRLARQGSAHKDHSQALFDLFFKDMDRSLREMGTGDMGVPKKIQKMGELFYGLVEKLNQAVDANDRPALVALCKRNFDTEDDALDAEALASYISQQDAHLASLDANEIVNGKFAFGDINVHV